MIRFAARTRKQKDLPALYIQGHDGIITIKDCLLDKLRPHLFFFPELELAAATHFKQCTLFPLDNQADFHADDGIVPGIRKVLRLAGLRDTKQTILQIMQIGIVRAIERLGHRAAPPGAESQSIFAQRSFANSS